jgi:hypothetical protein
MARLDNSETADIYSTNCNPAQLLKPLFSEVIYPWPDSPKPVTLGGKRTRQRIEKHTRKSG